MASLKCRGCGVPEYAEHRADCPLALVSSIKPDAHGYQTDQAEVICEDLVPAWRALFLQKNAKYRAVGNNLGARGVFPDINRKVGILKDRVWDGNETEGESTEEVINDLIGHLFLMQYMLLQEEE